MSSDNRRVLPTAPLLSALALMTLPAVAVAQWERLPVDPDVAVKEGFDTGRAIFWTQPNFVPLRNPEWRSLTAARRSRRGFSHLN